MYFPNLPDDPLRVAPPGQAPGESEPDAVDTAAIERSLDVDLQHALAWRRQLVCGLAEPVSTAEELYAAAQSSSRAREAWIHAMSALARRGASDAEILTHMRRWHAIAYSRLLADLVEQVEDGQRVSFHRAPAQQ